MAHSAIDVAKAIISMSDPEVGDIISNLKLQKLLYYAQGFSLALFNRPLFHEEIRAWNYGPVVCEVYHEYKGHGSHSLPHDPDFDCSMFSEEEIDLLKEIYELYGQFSALKLMNMTHEETPWRETRRDGVISNLKMKRFFDTLVEE